MKRKIFCFSSFFSVVFVMFISAACSNANNSVIPTDTTEEDDLRTFIFPIDDDLDSSINSITESCRIKLDGEISPEMLQDIGSALQSLYTQNSDIRIELDLSLTTGLEIMPHEGFRGCLSLESIVFPEGLITVEVEPFDHLDNLKKVYFPSTVNSIGAKLLTGCYSFERLSLSENNPNFMLVNDVLYTKDYAKLLAYPIYKTNRTFVIPSQVHEIQKVAFEGNTHLQNITVPSGITCIDELVFLNCVNLSKVILPSSITSLKQSAFRGCGKLTEICFRGTQTQWESIEKEDDWNEGCPSNMTIIYNYEED